MAATAQRLLLANGIPRGTALVRWKLALVLSLSLGAAALGAGVLTQPPPAKEQPGEPKQVVEPPPPKKECERAGKDIYGDPLPPGAIARLGTVRFRNCYGRQAVACSPDGKSLAVTDGDIVRLWDRATGKEIRRYRGQRDHFQCLAYSADGKFLAAGAGDKIIRLWDAATAQELRRFEGHQDKEQAVSATPVSQVLFTPDGKGLVSTGADDTIRLWDVATGKEIRRFEGHRDHVWGIALAADGKTVAAYCKKPVSNDENKPAEVCLWEVATGKALRKWLLPDDLALEVFSPDLKFLVTGLRNGGGPDELKLWDVESGKVVRTLPKASHSVAFSADGKTLFSVRHDFIYRVDVATRKELRRVKNPYPSSFSDVTLHPDGKTLLFSGSNHTIQFVDLTTGKGLGHFEGHNRTVDAVAFSPDGKLVATGENEELRLWDPATQKQLRRITGHPSFVTALAFAPDGKTLLSGSANNTTHHWEVASGRAIKTLNTYGSVMAFSPDRKVVATSVHPRQSIWLWDAATGKELLRLTEPLEEWNPQSFDFSPDGKTLAADGGQTMTIRLWEMATGKELPPLGKHRRLVSHVAFSPDGRLLAAKSWDETIHLWELATRRERLIVNTGGNVTLIAFSPGGRFLATANQGRYRRASKDGTTGNEEYDKVLLVDVATGKVIHRFSGHNGGVACLAFSPDGKRLASGGIDTTTLVWDVASVLPKERAVPLSESDLKALWADLTGEDAAKAHRAVWTLTKAPAQSVPFLKGRVWPVPPADPRLLTRLLADFRSDRFAVRQGATRELEKLGVLARPALRKALAGKPPLEIRRRIELLLERPDGSSSIQALRAAEVLENVGTAEARRVLEALAGGVPEARLTQEARASLERLAKRPAP